MKRCEHPRGSLRGQGPKWGMWAFREARPAAVLMRQVNVGVRDVPGAENHAEWSEDPERPVLGEPVTDPVSRGCGGDFTQPMSLPSAYTWQRADH